MRRLLATPPLCAGLLLATAIATPVEAGDASQECQGGLPTLALLEGNGHAVNGYLADCGNGTSRKALVIPDGAAASGDGITCSLGGEPFDLTADAVVADGIRADSGDTVRCRDGRSFKLRAGAGAPLPGGTTCEVRDQILVGHFTLSGQDEVKVTVAAMLIKCNGSSALIAPLATTTTVDPIIEDVQLRCPDHRFMIRNQASGQSVGGQLVVVPGDQINGCEAQLKGRNRETASFALTLPCGGSDSKCVFVSSTRHRGSSFGGLASADSECTAVAAGAGLPGSYKAWLSDSTASPSTRFNKAAVPYRLVDGTQIAADWNDLVTCNADESVCLDNPISLTEDGTDTSDFPQQAQRPWTGTRTSGIAASSVCQDWTGGPYGVDGSTRTTSWAWTGAFSGGGSSSWYCSANKPFFCFQQ